jgi:hypothetical protein
MLLIQMKKMTTINELTGWAKDKAKEYPNCRAQVFEFVSLCEDEIEQGGSESHEVQLAYNDICDLVGIDE